MDDTIAALLPLLDWVAGVGAGVLASWLFDRLREDAVIPDAWRAILYTARYARYISLALSAGLAVLAASLAAALRGEPVLDVADATLAAILAAQIRHALTSLPAEPPVITVDTSR